MGIASILCLLTDKIGLTQLEPHVQKENNRGRSYARNISTLANKKAILAGVSASYDSLVG